MIKNLTDTDMASQGYPSSGRQLKEQDETEWPEWLSPGDRRLLQATTVTPNVTVAADGSGDFLTVSEAVASAPERSKTRYIIKIKAGVYRENVDVPRRKTNLMFVGDGRVNTIITASRNVVDGSTTFNSSTVGEYPV
ncbi:pectinesterase family protein [Hibiscus syriacus]|uniref:Pectinesterase family protein n=1 Tax=Hibiscus syriacus TaxID=106335 RepID=A0A6A2XJI4_HIBSY|nr:pectinesterase family protein [Hibiscus syriacus]